MLSPYANSAVLASRAVKQTYKGLIAELYAIHNGKLTEVIICFYIMDQLKVLIAIFLNK